MPALVFLASADSTIFYQFRVCDGNRNPLQNSTMIYVGTFTSKCITLLEKLEDFPVLKESA